MAARRSATRSTQGKPTRHLLQGWMLQHQRALHHSLKQLLRTPFSSLLTILVIGFSLALPTGFLLALYTLEEVFTGWTDSFEISIFLKTEIDDQRGSALAEQLRQHTQVSKLRFIDKEEAFEEFQRLSGFPEAVDALERNPLPGIILLHLRPDADRAARDALIERLGKLPEVDRARLDHHWALRLSSITELLRRIVSILAVVFFFAVPLIIGNTVRLGILNKREVIRIYRLFGASSAFICRPFLYTGLCFGLGGGLASCGMLTGALILLRPPVTALAESYNSSFYLQGLTWSQAVALVGISIFLSLAGAWFSVNRHILALKI